MADTYSIKTLYLLTLALMLSGVDDLQAQEVACPPPRHASSGVLDEVVWSRLNTIYEDIAEGRFNEAFEKLDKLLDRADRDPYLQAIINQALAHVEWSREKPESALAYFEQALALDALPDPAHFSLLLQLARLYFMQERFDLALERLEEWFCAGLEENITATAYVLQASIFIELEDFARALHAIENAIALEGEPRESWYQLKLAAHYELKQYPRAATTLEEMIEKWPARKTYWMQLSQIYFRLKFPERSLAVIALAHRNGLLDKQADLIYLSNLYSQLKVPYKSAAVMEEGIRQGIVAASAYHWTIVAEAWYAADELEKSLVAFEQAGVTADDGGMDLRRGFILVDLERWQAALTSLNLALEKGGLDERRTGEAYLLRGMTQFNLGNLDKASVDWSNAERFELTREAARQWMNHLKNL